jgi:hypothetical protein
MMAARNPIQSKSMIFPNLPQFLERHIFGILAQLLKALVAFCHRDILHDF